MPSGLTGSPLHKTEGEASFLTGHLWTSNPGPRLRRERSNRQLSGAGVHRYTTWQSQGCMLGPGRPASLPPYSVQKPLSLFYSQQFILGVTAFT